MSGVNQEGRTVKDAVRKGLAKLGMPKEDVDIVVLDKGSRGILGLFGRRPAQVKLVPTVSDEKTRRVVEKLLSMMGFGGQVEVTVNGNRIQVSIETAGMDGLLIGRHGQTLDALQHVIERMVNRGRRDRARVTVDVGNYRKRRRTSRPSDGRRNRNGGGRRRNPSAKRPEGELVRARES